MGNKSHTIYKREHVQVTNYSITSVWWSAICKEKQCRGVKTQGRVGVPLGLSTAACNTNGRQINVVVYWSVYQQSWDTFCLNVSIIFFTISF